MSEGIYFLKLVKENDVYFVKENTKKSQIFYKKQPLSNATFTDWFPIACVSFYNKKYLIKFSKEKKCVLWKLNNAYEFVSHLFFSEQLYNSKKNLAFLIQKILKPLEIIDNNEFILKRDFFLNSLNLDIVIPSWTNVLGLEEFDAIRLLEIPLNIENTYTFFDSVSSCYSKKDDSRGKSVPALFGGNARKMAYQEDALLLGKFYIADIFSDADLLVNRSIVLSPFEIAYVCKNKFTTYYIIATGALGLLTQIYIPRFNIAIYKNHHTNYYNNNCLHTIKLLIQRIYECPDIFEVNDYYIAKEKNTCLITGINATKNMYHILANELAGIGRLSNYPNIKSKFCIACTKSISLLGLNEQSIEELTNPFGEKLYDLNIPSTIPHLNNSYFSCFLRSNYEVTEPIRVKILDIISTRAQSLSHNLDWDNWNNKNVLLVGIRAGRRRWVNQVEGLVTLINKLNDVIPNLLVVFDGTCSVDFDDKSTEHHIIIENKIVKSIVEQTKNVESISLIGAPAFISIFGASKCLFYVSPWGAGLTKYQILANKKGIVHTNTEVIKHWSSLFYCWERVGMPEIKYSQPLSPIDFKNDAVDTQIDNSTVRSWLNDHQADPEDLFKLITEHFKVI